MPEILEIIAKRAGRRKALKIAVWGTGIAAKEYMQLYDERMKALVQVVGFVDNNVEKQGVEFFGYPVVSWKGIGTLRADRIVLMNRFAREILDDLEEKNCSFLDSIISEEEFFQYYMDSGIWKEKRVLFLGNKMMYELAEYRAAFSFQKVGYYEKIEDYDSSEQWDAVFLCTERLMNQEKQLQEEHEMRKVLVRECGFEEKMVFGYAEWIRYLVCNRRITCGDNNPDVCFYLLAVPDPIRGWGTLLTEYLRCIQYAKEKHMIPVIDMKNMKSQYLPTDMIGKENAWENFFLPVSEATLEDVYSSKNVVLSGMGSCEIYTPDFSDISFNEKTLRYVENEKKRLFPRKKKVLGVIYRGTDYYNAYQHAKPLAITEYIEVTKEKLKESGCEYVFLATEVDEAVTEFKRAFSDQVICTEQKRYPQSERRLLSTIAFDRKQDEYWRGLEYLTVLFLLSQCDAIMGMDTGAFQAAVSMNEGRYEYCFRL